MEEERIRVVSRILDFVPEFGKLQIATNVLKIVALNYQLQYLETA